MSIWRLILTNLRQHRVRTLIGAAGIALGAATMLSVVGLLGGGRCGCSNGFCRVMPS